MPDGIDIIQRMHWTGLESCGSQIGLPSNVHELLQTSLLRVFKAPAKKGREGPPAAPAPEEFLAIEDAFAVPEQERQLDDRDVGGAPVSIYVEPQEQQVQIVCTIGSEVGRWQLT